MGNDEKGPHPRQDAVQIREAWQCLGEWVELEKPHSSILTRENLHVGADSTPDEMAQARADWAELRAQIRERIPADTILCLPTTSGVAPKLRDEDARTRFAIPSLLMLSIAVLGGLPQISVPAATVEGLPVGLSLVGPAGADEGLLELACAVGR